MKPKRRLKKEQSPSSPKQKATETTGDGDEGDGDEEDAPAEVRELVTAAATESTAGDAPVRLRRPPAPSPQRQVKDETVEGTHLLPVGELAQGNQEPFTEKSLAEAVIAAALHYGPDTKRVGGGGYRTGGHMVKLARAEFPFPEERILGSDIDANAQKVKDVIVAGVPGGVGGYALTASGGLCAPLTPIYSMPNFATDAEPVWDSLPVFRAARGGVNVPTATSIADITTAISSISEANDALGGTFATKSCQDLDCPEYTETAVQIFAHCREYGNLNARAWPEKIAHENALTMAALSRHQRGLHARPDQVALHQRHQRRRDARRARSTWSTRSSRRIRDQGPAADAAQARFRALLPSYVLDLLLLDTIQTPFDRFQSKAESTPTCVGAGIDPVYYLDTSTPATRSCRTLRRRPPRSTDCRTRAVGDLPRRCVHRNRLGIAGARDRA